MFIRKKKLGKYMREIKDRNRAKNLGQDYREPISEKDANTNMYLQGYKDGIDNFYNVLCAMFNIKP